MNGQRAMAGINFWCPLVFLLLVSMASACSDESDMNGESDTPGTSRSVDGEESASQAALPNGVETGPPLSERDSEAAAESDVAHLVNLDRSEDSFVLPHPPSGYSLVNAVSGMSGSEGHTVETLFFAHETDPGLAVAVGIHRLEDETQIADLFDRSAVSSAALVPEYPSARIVEPESEFQPGDGDEGSISLVLRVSANTWIWVVGQSPEVSEELLTEFFNSMEASP